MASIIQRVLKGAAAGPQVAMAGDDVSFSGSENEASGSEAEASAPEPEVIQTPPKKKKDKKKCKSPRSSKKEAAPGKTASAKQKGRENRHRPSNGKHKRTCKSCGKTLDASAFAVNQSNCERCKKGLDVIAKKARSQGKTQWLSNQKACPKKLQSMLSNYHAACDDAQRSGSKKATWTIAAYEESIRATSGTKFIDEGELMWQDQAIQFFQTPAGKNLTQAQAKSKWEAMIAAMDEHTVHDKEGPPHAPLRLRVHVADKVNFASSYKRDKCLACSWSLPKVGFGASFTSL